MCFMIYFGKAPFSTALYSILTLDRIYASSIRERTCLNAFCPAFLCKIFTKKVLLKHYVSPTDPNKTLLPCRSNSSWPIKLINHINRKRRFQTFFTPWSEPPIFVRLYTVSVRSFIWGLSDPLTCLRVKIVLQTNRF